MYVKRKWLQDFYMEQAFREALKAYSKKEVPVGCIIKDDEIIAVGHNSIEGEKMLLCHAEIVALRQQTILLIGDLTTKMCMLP